MFLEGYIFNYIFLYFKKDGSLLNQLKLKQINKPHLIASNVAAASVLHLFSYICLIPNGIKN